MTVVAKSVARLARLAGIEVTETVQKLEGGEVPVANLRVAGVSYPRFFSPDRRRSFGP
jgi:hypothetical protein